MTWSIGFDERWQRDIGYGVPATCDFPGCGARIDRGLSYVCGGEPYGEPRGCGLYFCAEHINSLPCRLDGEIQYVPLCARCHPRRRVPFKPTPDAPEWVEHKLTDPSWQHWRDENPDEVVRLQTQKAPQQPAFASAGAR